MSNFAGENNYEEAIETMKTYPVLQSQLGVILHCMRHTNSTQYNLPSTIYIPATVDSQRLLRTYNTIVNDVPELHTRFMVDALGNVRQWSDPSMTIPVIWRESTEAELQEYVRNGFVRPFNLFSGEPLFRLEVVKTEKGYCLLTDASHTICDGMSFSPILLNLFAKAFDGGRYEPSGYGMYEAAEDEVASFGTEAYQRAKEYYAKKFGGLEMATLSRSTPGSMGKMGRRSAYVDRKECDDWCHAHGTQPNLLFMAAFGHVMSVLTRKEKVAYFTVNHGRIDKRLRGCVGMFVKSVPVIADARPDMTVTEFIKSQRTELMSTIRYGTYPFSHFCLDLGMTPGIMFNFQALPEMEEMLHLSEGDISAVQPVRGDMDTDIGVLIFFKGSDYEIRVESSLAMNDEATMQMLADAIRATVLNMMAAPDACLRDIAITSREEREPLLALGAGEHLDYDTADTMVSLFRKQAAKTPDAIAVVFEERMLTYRQLDEITDRLASHLVEHYGVQQEEAVGVMVDRSELMPIYSMAVMKAGAAYMPLDFKFPADRLQYMCDDASVRLILSEGNRVSQSLPTFQGQVFLAETLPEVQPSAVSLPQPQSAGRFVILYTSGSTGQPKGVALEHRNIVNFCHWYIKEAGITPSDRLLAFSNYGFDTHMMDLYPAIFSGASTYIVSSEMRMDVIAMNSYMEANNITIAFMTTQIGYLFATSLSNRSLRLLVVAGEKLNPMKKPAFLVQNAYGPTESFVTTFYNIEHDYDSSLIGRPLANYQLYIVDRNMQLLPRGAAGELVVGGVGVARGYLHPAEKDAHKFTEFMGGHCYRTGDLVRWADDGNLEFLGRIDNQVKIRGYRIELGEIEACAAKYEGIALAAVVVHDGQTICLYYTSDGAIDEDALRQYLASHLAGYMVPTAYVKLPTMPLNANGKIDRRRLPKPEVSIEEIVAPETEMEQRLFDLVAEQLQTTQFGVTTDLVSIGLTSLTAMRLSMLATQRYSVALTVNDILTTPTVRQLATIAEKNAQADIVDLLTYYRDQDYYPLTENQRGIYIDWEMNRNTTQYNLPTAIRLGHLDAERMADALRKVVDAHGYLKTRLAYHDGDIVQQRRYDAEAEVLLRDLDNEPDRAFFQQRVRPFNLFDDNLYRIEVYRWQDSVYLFRDFHHIINDGLSDAAFYRDVLTAYSGGEVQPEAVTAFDFAIYEQELRNESRYAEAGEYFSRLLDGMESASFPHSSHTDSTDRKAATVTASISSGSTIDEACRRMGITASSYFQTVLAQVLHRLTRQESIALATVSGGRSLSQMENMTGMFVKTIPMTSTSGTSGETFAEAAARMHRQSIETVARDFYPLTAMVEQSGFRPEILFAFNSGIYDSVDIPFGTDVELITLELDTQKLPIEMMAYNDRKGAYHLHVSYDTALYSQPDMQALADAIVTYAQNATKAGVTLADIEMTTAEERKALVELGTGIQMDIDITKTFVDAFEECAAKMPDNVAVVDRDGQLTYREMSHRSNVMARQLIDAGVQPNDFVCVMLDRFKEFPLSVLAIHKAGAAYTPMDLEYPNDRLQYMLENSESKVLITSHSVLESKRAEGEFESGNVQTLFIDDMDFCVEAAPVNLATPDNLAYMIYTSGSTGKPKGAVLHHAGLWNFINVIIGAERLTAADRIEGHRSFSFDAHIEDMFPILTLGGSFHVMPTEIRKDLAAIREFLLSHQITGGGFTTSIASLLLSSYDDLPMRFMTAGGEKLSGVYSDNVEIINVYGPTECTCDTSYYSIPPGKHVENIPIGKPVANTWNFIVDGYGNMVPRGMVGELCIAGIQVGRGYWRLPERTSQAFADCPFVSVDRWGRKVDMYHSGDLCRWNAQGDIEYIGRMDNQVKLRGFRIELGEIESCAAKYSGMRQVVAMVSKVGDLDILCLYFTADNGKVDTEGLKAFMAERLANYMVPAVFMQLDAMPLNANGKIDRRRLSKPELTLSLENVAPRTEKESELLSIAREVVGRDDFGVTDDLAALGLTSIGAIRMAAMAAAKGIKISVNDMMRRHTIESAFMANSEPGYWVNGYDAAKPVLVVAHGIVFTASMLEKFRLWQEHFSIYAIEPIDEHSDRLFADADFTATISYYAAMLDRDIPATARVFAFIGYSFGGEQAYWLAQRWQQMRGYAANVYMGDSHLRSKSGMAGEEEIAKYMMDFAKEHPEDIETMGIKVTDAQYAETVLQIAVKKLDTVNRLSCDVPFPHYDGRVVLFNALRENTDLEANMARWREVAPRLETADIDDHHLNIAHSNKHNGIVTDCMLRDLKEQQ